MIHIRCRCGKQLAVPEAYLAHPAVCPACRQPMQLVAPAFGPGTDDFVFALVIEQGPERVGEQIFLGGREPIDVGKRADNNIVLNDVSVSRYHCRLTRTDFGWCIEDQGSKNGVRINGDRVLTHDLNDADMIRLGHFTLRYVDTSLIAPTDPRSADRTPATPDAAQPDDGLYGLAEMEDTQPTVEIAPVPPVTPGPAASSPPTTTYAESGAPGPVCPCCERQLTPGAKICVECGIDLKTGRAVLTTYDGHLDKVYEVTERVLSVVTWIIWTGLYPVASEALGICRPYAIQAIAGITVLITAWFWAYEWTGSPEMRSYKNLMLWCGEADPTPAQLEYYYSETSYGDAAAFKASLAELEAASPKNTPSPEKRGPGRASRRSRAALVSGTSRVPRADEAERMLAAYRNLTPEQQCLGRYRPSQLITHAFLHADVMHLIGNLLFLLVIGSRVNGLIGNIGTVLLYPALAVAGGLAELHSFRHLSPTPGVGASGAIMGLAGMYLVLLPIPNVHMVAWFRWGLIRRFHLSLKFFAVRGFWVVLFYIAFDVAATLLGMQDGVAHWAHLGGFLAGVAVGLALLVSRLVNCRGGDILSAILGRRAWALIGKPNRRERFH